MRSSLVSFVVIGALWSVDALAQEAPLPPPPPMVVVAVGPVPRVGLEVGGGVQGGKIICEGEMGKCNGFTEAGGVNLNASWFWRPDLGITFDAWAMAHSSDGFTFAHYINTVGIKWRPVPIVTLTAGIGEAHASLGLTNTSLAVTSDDAFAIMAAASLDVLRGRRWALAVEARFGNGFYGDANHDGMPDVVGRNVGAGASLTMFGF